MTQNNARLQDNEAAQRQVLTAPIGFNRATLVGKEIDYIGQAVEREKLSSNGWFTQRCRSLLDTSGSLSHTDDLSARLIRLPLHPQLGARAQENVVAALEEVLDG